VKAYANSKGVFLKGDIPFLVSADSSGVWYDMQSATDNKTKFADDCCVQAQS
jgi:4-alpha-glucanotransferase